MFITVSEGTLVRCSFDSHFTLQNNQEWSDFVPRSEDIVFHRRFQVEETVGAEGEDRTPPGHRRYWPRYLPTSNQHSNVKVSARAYTGRPRSRAPYNKFFFVCFRFN